MLASYHAFFFHSFTFFLSIYLSSFCPSILFLTDSSILVSFYDPSFFPYLQPPFHLFFHSSFNLSSSLRPPLPLSPPKLELKLITAREEGEAGSGGGSDRPSSIQLIPGFLEVVDLLKNLPEASNRSSPLSQCSVRVVEVSRSPSVPPPPPPPSVGASALVASSIVSLQPGEAKAKTRIGKMSPAKCRKGQEALEGEEVSTVCWCMVVWQWWQWCVCECVHACMCVWISTWTLFSYNICCCFLSPFLFIFHFSFYLLIQFLTIF